MLYLVVDPHFLYLPQLGEVSQQQAAAYLRRMVEWSMVLNDDQIQLGLSAPLRRTLRQYMRTNPQSEDYLRDLFDHAQLSAYYKDAYPALLQFFARIFSTDERNFDHWFDAINLRHDLAYEPMYPRYIDPEWILDRLPIGMRHQYRTMLESLAFARTNSILPLSQFRHTRILTTFSPEEFEHPHYKQQISLGYQVDILVDGELKTHTETAAAQTQIHDTIDTVYHVSQLAGIVPKAPQFASVLEAARAAVEAFPDTLIWSELAESTAASSNYPDPNTIYRLLVGLATDFLPDFRNGSNPPAGEAFYKKYRFQYAANEGQQVRLKFRRYYEVTIDGVDFFCQRHIKLGTGRDCARINFEVDLHHNSGGRIILARVGVHGPNAHNPR